MKKQLNPLSQRERVGVRVNLCLTYLFILVILLSSCSSQPQAAPTTTSIPPTATALPTETPVSPTDTPSPTQDPTLFGAIGVNEVQGMVLETFASAIFTKTMDNYVASADIQEYQITSVTIFPGNAGFLAEIIYNVKTDNPTWLADGGTQTPDGWVNGNCSRFDFVTTETEYQLKNKRLCN